MDPKGGVMQFFLSMLLLISSVAVAESRHFLPLKKTTLSKNYSGFFELVNKSQDHEYKFLNCQPGQDIELAFELEETLVVKNAVKGHLPIQFKSIDDWAQLIPNPLYGVIGFRRAVSEFDKNSGDVKILSQTKYCSSAGSCFLQDWTTHAEVQYFRDGDDQLRVILYYKPFKSSEVESCEFVAK